MVLLKSSYASRREPQEFGLPSQAHVYLCLSTIRLKGSFGSLLSPDHYVNLTVPPLFSYHWNNCCLWPTHTLGSLGELIYKMTNISLYVTEAISSALASFCPHYPKFGTPLMLVDPLLQILCPYSLPSRHCSSMNLLLFLVMSLCLIPILILKPFPFHTILTLSSIHYLLAWVLYVKDPPGAWLHQSIPRSTARNRTKKAVVMEKHPGERSGNGGT